MWDLILYDSVCSFACHVEHRFHNNISYFSLGFLSNGLLASIIFFWILDNNVSISSTVRIVFRCKHRLCVSKSRFSYRLYRSLVLLVVQCHVSSYFLIFHFFTLLQLPHFIPTWQHNPVFIHQSVLKHSVLIMNSLFTNSCSCMG